MSTRDHYVLHVSCGPKPSAANKRSVQNAGRTYGLSHPVWRDARRAAVNISLLPAVRHVAVELVVGRGIFVKGKRFEG